MYNQWSFKMLNTIGLLVHLLLVDIPKDIKRWLTLRAKDVAGNIIVITGGASGLGSRMAQILAIEKRALLVIIDIDLDGAEKTVSSIVDGGGQAEAYQCDIRKADELERTAQQIQQKYGQLTINHEDSGLLLYNT
ncbi:3-oxoacyl-[acyl-carrier-protein] reductase domain protein [Ancylostoma ceylanicum]|uniref:3-oxoacyl-[acyl-carrier-protein] reductase domain protein n=1 Tax=Ancylostoma ceylanicum TaxID=53326 RepID=A0A0D6L737_9BILA|nr:3-oxoacyl-[acyl-carrier-protein] reductase domain protein [Ancylostoma ceylanicum]